MYATMPKTQGANSLIDLRSDTVTKPSAAMRDVMANAEVGDDVYGDDPTVSALEEYTADLLGKEAGLFVTSGTQSNLVSLLTHCGRGHEYISGVDYHIPKYEAGGAAVLGGISPKHLPLNATGGLSADAVAAAIQPDDPHFAISRLLCVENTYNGKVMDQADMEAAAATAHDHGLSVHLDGARLMNAVVKSGRPAAELVKFADTVSLCLSKGLGAPVGSVLCGPADFIAKAKRARKMLGGGLRQSGVLAACGLYALQHNVDRLQIDHENAHTMAHRLLDIDGVELDSKSVQTNMIWMNLNKMGAEPLSAHMQAKGMVVSNPSGASNTIRLVTHLDFDESHIDRVVDGFASWLGTAA